MIARKTFREVWMFLLIYSVVMLLILVPAISLWPELYALAQKSVSPVKIAWVERLWNATREAAPEIAFRNYFAIQAYFKGVNICGVAAAVLIGTGAIARERENRTLEFLLARPVSRSRILFSKYWVMAVGLVLPVFLVNWLAIPLSRWMVDEALPFWPITLASLHASLFVLVILHLTLLCSAIFRTQAHTAAATGIVIVSQVTIYFVPRIRAGSLFKLSDFDVYGPTIMGNLRFPQLMGGMGIWMLLACGVMYFAADRLLRRIDP